MKKAQIFSMDFVLTFVAYMLAVSVFLLAVEHYFFSESNTLEVDSEYLFDRIENTHDDRYSFLDGARITVNFDDAVFDDYFYGDTYNGQEVYGLFFNSTPNAFRRVDYCIYLIDDSGITQASFEAYAENYDEYGIYFQNERCGINRLNPYTAVPRCIYEDSIVVTKPVLYGGEIMQLKILVCGDRI